MSTTLFTHCTIFPGAWSAVIDNGFILVNGNRIVGIGPMEQVPPPGTARVIDVGGHTMGHCA